MVLTEPMHVRLQAQLKACLGPRLAVVCSSVDADPDTLWCEERVAVTQAVPRRQREFAAGRAAARLAMQQLGWSPSPVPSNPDRSPSWPEGLVGGLSHSSTTCLVVMGRKEDWLSLGIDIEPDSGIEPSLWSTVCSTKELSWIYSYPATERPLLVSHIFTAKEAFYKSCNSEQQAKLDFHNCTTTLWKRVDHNLQSFVIVPNNKFHKARFGYSMHDACSVISWILQDRAADFQDTKAKPVD
jgi:4'-phosphopantetheinyl transferase EntD